MEESWETVEGMGLKSSHCMPAGRKRDKTKLHVVSCYAPTKAASRQVKDTFFQDLESILAAIPSGEKYVILDDFMLVWGPGSV